VALNKVDLTGEWKLGEGEERTLRERGWHMLKTSAKTGEGVEDAFTWLARQSIAAGEKPS